jgi:hypothetical protein
MLAGSDGVLFGMLILLAGSLAILNVWAVIDTRAALDAAAREYLRTYTEQSSADAAATAGELAARRLLDERGTPVTDLWIVEPDGAAFGPCQPAQVAFEAEVPAARLPSSTTSAPVDPVTHRELVDPHREVTSGPTTDPTRRRVPPTESIPEVGRGRECARPVPAMLPSCSASAVSPST